MDRRSFIAASVAALPLSVAEASNKKIYYVECDYGEPMTVIQKELAADALDAVVSSFRRDKNAAVESARQTIGSTFADWLSVMEAADLAQIHETFVAGEAFTDVVEVNFPAKFFGISDRNFSVILFEMGIHQ